MATTDPEGKKVSLWDLYAAACRGTAEHEQLLAPELSRRLREKRKDAEALAAYYRQEGVPEGEIPHLLALGGYGGLA